MKRTKEVSKGGFTGRRAVVVCFREKTPQATDDTKDELSFLSYTLGLKVVKVFVVHIHQVNPATYIGKGKLEEIKLFLAEEKLDILIFGCEISPVQQRNIENGLDISVIDRTELILYIFGAHAKTREGKLQVELAHLNYVLPRLTGRGVYLSRLGGGVGTRGPGEMKLEVHRRRIKERLHRLNKEIKEIEKHRKLIRDSKRRAKFPQAALVGYTNVGKSSLLNRLSSSSLDVANRLFSTLDPATRAVHVGEQKICLISDTVGLLKNIPHHLIEAFKSTLEELNYADLIICLYDISSTNISKQRETISTVLKGLAVEDIPRLDVFNKIDIADGVDLNLLRGKYPGDVFVSAVTGEGIDELKAMLLKRLYE